LATGDAVNVAARLEQAAEANEVLVGAETLALVQSAVEIGEERLLELKGKSEPMPGYPLVLCTRRRPPSSISSRSYASDALSSTAPSGDRSFSCSPAIQKRRTSTPVPPVIRPPPRAGGGRMRLNKLGGWIVL
jgi:hypothetical protein